jgi:hypothetical protein
MTGSCEILSMIVPENVTSRNALLPGSSAKQRQMQQHNPNARMEIFRFTIYTPFEMEISTLRLKKAIGTS